MTPNSEPSTPTTPTAAPRIPIEQIAPSKTNPRKSFPASDLAILTQSVKKHGVFSPLTLRPHPSKPGFFEIVDGECRYRAAKEAGVTAVPADVQTLTDDEVIERQLVSFILRKDLTPLEEAEGYNGLLKKRYTHERIAEQVGKSEQYIRDRCRLLRLTEGARELLLAGRIETGHANLLARLDPVDQARTIRVPDGSANHSGLWQAQRSLPRTSEEIESLHQGRAVEKAEGDLKAVSVRELAAWIDRHVKLNPTAPENAELFPEVAEAVKAAATKVPGEKPPKVIHITFENVLADDVKRVDGPRVYGPRSWTRADGKAGSKSCAASVIGIVIAGDARGEAFAVCIAKKTCQVHYKAEITAAAKRERDVEKSGKTGQDRWALEQAKRKADQEARDLARKRFDRAIPALRVALAEKAVAAPLAEMKLLVESGLNGGEHEALKRCSSIPAGKSSDDFIRRIGMATGLAAVFDYYVDEDRVERVAKRFKVDVAKVIASANANDLATKAAKSKAKPAKRKKAGK